MATESLSFQAILRWSDDECRGFLEGMRWPNGAICPKCGAGAPYNLERKSGSKNKVQKLYKCRSCRKQFTATVGSIFEDSKIPLNKWFAAIMMMCTSKKGVSAHQLHRSLDITYKSAWFMAHRVREAMREKGTLLPFTGTVEADETYIGGKPRGHNVWKERAKDEAEMGLRPRPKNRAPYQDKVAVFGMIERGGLVRTIKVPQATAGTLGPILRANMDMTKARLMTDGSNVYKHIKRHVRHDVVNHEVTYVAPNGVHTQGIENYWSLLKRGLYGVFHHVGEDYLPCYLNEFEYRFNRRKVSDAERFAALMAQTQGRLLWYCQTPQPENPHA